MRRAGHATLVMLGQEFGGYDAQLVLGQASLQHALTARMRWRSAARQWAPA